MKKIIALCAAVLTLTAVASAQPRAVGLRLGYGVEASYQHTFGSNFGEVTLGLEGPSFLSVHASYNFIVAKPTWTSEGEWNVYVGPYAGFCAENAYACVDLGGIAGLEYTFKFPLQLSIDVRPCVRVGGDPGVSFRGFCPMLGVRYRF